MALTDHLRRLATTGLSVVVAVAAFTAATPAQAASPPSDPSGTAKTVSDAAASAGQPRAVATKRHSLVRVGQQVRVAPLDAPSGVEVGLPVQGSAAATETTDTTVLGGAAPGSAVAVQSLGDDSARALVSVPDAASPAEFRFPLVVPAGARVAMAGNGGVVVMQPVQTTVNGTQKVTGAHVLAVFAPAWARDAKGAPVPTHYSIEGTTIVQHLSLSAGVAYPVTADPTWTWSDFQISWNWWDPFTLTVYFNKRGTSAVLSGAYWIAAAVIGALAATPCSLVCAAVGVFAVIGAVFYGAAPAYGLCGKQTIHALSRSIVPGVYRGAFCR